MRSFTLARWFTAATAVCLAIVTPAWIWYGWNAAGAWIVMAAVFGILAFTENRQAHQRRRKERVQQRLTFGNWTHHTINVADVLKPL